MYQVETVPHQRKWKIFDPEAQSSQRLAIDFDTVLATLPLLHQVGEAGDVHLHAKGLLELGHLFLSLVKPKEHLYGYNNNNLYGMLPRERIHIY